MQQEEVRIGVQDYQQDIDDGSDYSPVMDEDVEGLEQACEYYEF